jgi:hypothetical protein
MGMLDKWLGGKNDYPPLPADDAARARLNEVKPELEKLATKVRDHLSYSGAHGCHRLCCRLHHERAGIRRRRLPAAARGPAGAAARPE